MFGKFNVDCKPSKEDCRIVNCHFLNNYNGLPKDLGFRCEFSEEKQKFECVLRSHYNYRCKRTNNSLECGYNNERFENDKNVQDLEIRLKKENYEKIQEEISKRKEKQDEFRNLFLCDSSTYKSSTSSSVDDGWIGLDGIGCMNDTFSDWAFDNENNCSGDWY